MIDETDLGKIKEVVEALLQKMTVTVFNIQIAPHLTEGDELKDGKENKDFIDIDVNMQDPQVLIGQNGQTLFELARLLRLILNKKLQKGFYVNLDINDYKKKKLEYLKDLALTSANEVVLTKEKKVLSPMPAYERRIIHTELSLRQDVVTESQGEGEGRCIVISPR